MIEYKAEPWLEVEDEILPKMRRNAEEAYADIDAEIYVDRDFYRRCAASGTLLVITARSAGAIVGYCLFHVYHHWHFKALLAASSDAYWVEPSWRVGFSWVGLRMLKYAMEVLKLAGVRLVTANAPGRSAVLFEKLGFREFETNMLLEVK